MIDSKVFPLSAPINWGNQTVKELKLRPITGKDLMGLKMEFDPQGGKLVVDTTVALTIAYRLSNVPTPVLEQMSGQDALMLSIEIQGFLLSGQYGGQTPLPLSPTDLEAGAQAL